MYHDQPDNRLNHPIFDCLPPENAEIQKDQYGIVIFPGEHGHPESREIAKGARYTGESFQKLLDRAGIPNTVEIVTTPKRAHPIIEIIRSNTQHVLTKFGMRTKKETDAIRHYKNFKRETQANFDVTLEHLRLGERLFHSAASHDAIGRVLALKEVHPEALIVHFDKHPDFQVPESHDNPGDTDAVNGHAIWGSVVTGVNHPLLNQLRPKGATRLLEREDLMMIGILHPDKSEAFQVAGIDPTTKEQVKKPIPCLTWLELKDLEEAAAKEKMMMKLRIWIDERKKKYGVEVVHIGIEDDPDSIRIEDIGPGNTMPTDRGLTAHVKADVLEWLSVQPDVKVSYYGTAEVIPKYDKEGKLKRQIMRWASASFGFGDTEYYHGGYGGGIVLDNRAEFHTESSKLRRVVSHIITATAASVLALIGAAVFEKPKTETVTEQASWEPLGKNYDRTYVFTGISSQNRFQPPGFVSVNMYSLERLKQGIREYTTAVSDGDSRLDYKQRLLFSILYLAELKRDTVPMWDHVKKSLTAQEYNTVVTEYQKFRASIGQPEQKEIDEYLKDYDHPTT